MTASRRTIAAVAAIAMPIATAAQPQATVRSPAADSVTVTVYRDDLALITETRKIELPSGPVTLIVDGVVDTLLPQSAVINGHDRPLAESNFSYDRLTPATLLTEAVGENVVLTRTDPASGRVTRTPATIVAANNGIVLRTDDGNEALHCSGLPERLEFERIPDGLLASPRLAVRLAGGAPGTRELTVTYLAHGFSWSADYIGRLNERLDRMQLSGWITLTNSTGTRFENAALNVVAGNLNVIDAAQGGSAGPEADGRFAGIETSTADAHYQRLASEASASFATLQGCFESPEPFFAGASDMAPLRARATAALEEVTITASHIAARETLGDYQLYRLPWHTDLGARQTKQIAFLDKDEVRVERFYAFRLDAFDAVPVDDVPVPSLHLAWENTARTGLGEPLPRGRVRIFEPHDNSMLFAGENTIEDRPVGLPVEIEIARALDLKLDVSTEEIDYEMLPGGAERVRFGVEHRIENLKGARVELEIRHAAGPDWLSPELEQSSQRAGTKNGDLMWRLRVPPGDVRTLSYEVAAVEAD